MKTDEVGASYDRMASAYASERERLKSGKYVNRLLGLLKPKSFLLDLGCGDGIPVDKELIRKGHLVTGLDISKVQIERARKNCKGGDFRIADISKLNMGEFRVDAVVSFYAIFHISRSLHADLFKKINSFLPVGGLILVTMGDKDFEGEHVLHGVKVWSSHFGVGKNTELVKQAGFEIFLNEVDDSSDERHQIIMARKI